MLEPLLKFQQLHMLIQLNLIRLSAHYTKIEWN